MATFVFSDGGYTTLNQTVTTTPAPGTVETWTLESTVGSPELPQITSGQQYPAAVFTPNLTLIPPQGTELNPEIVLVIAILNSTQVTVVRGYNGIVHPHSPGDVFQCVIAAEFLNSLSTFIGPFYNVMAYGAKGDGTTDDTAAFVAAYDAAFAAGGGIVFMPQPAASYYINTAGGIPWASGLVALWGSGETQTADSGGQPGACLLSGGPNLVGGANTILNITIGLNGHGLFQNFGFQRNYNAISCFTQTVATEVSVGTTFRNIALDVALGAPAFINTKCEDCVYDGLTFPYFETGYVQSCVFTIPYGAATLRDCFLLGEIWYNAQQFIIQACVTGPLIPVNTSDYAPQCLTSCTGSYHYDAPEDTVHTLYPACIGNGSELGPFVHSGCDFLMLNANTFCKGAMPAGALGVFDNCQFEQAAATGTTIYLIYDTAGAGLYEVRGGTLENNGSGNFTSAQAGYLTGSTSFVKFTNPVLNVTPPSLVIPLTVSAGAVTVPVPGPGMPGVYKIVLSATTAVTLATTGAVDGQFVELRTTDGGSAETMSFVNTENSTNASAPTTSAGSTTLPITTLFQFNGLTSKWRCMVSD